MSAPASLLGGVFDITRGDLEEAVFPFAPPEASLRGLATIRVLRLARFWQAEPPAVAVTLLESTELLIRGFFGQRLPWTFALAGNHADIQCWIGASTDESDEASLGSLVRSHFPDCRIAARRLDASAFAALPYGVVLTGTPAARARTTDSSVRDPLAQLCRALFGTRWLYLVSARPVAHVETVRRINEVAAKIKDARATFLLRNNPIDEDDRAGRRYVDLLEAKLRRLEQGRVSGMWDVRCSCYAESERGAQSARHLLESVFSGEDSLPDPVRARPFAVSPRSAPQLEPLTTAEVATLTQPPREEFPGFELVEAARFGVETGVASVGAVCLGDVLDRGTRTGGWLGVSPDDLTKHALIVGTTGSGKTNTCQWLLDQIWAGGKGIPFLVVESAKTEYRRLLREPRLAGLTVYTIGDETVSPLRLNPFEVRDGILVQTHVDYLKSLFSAAFVLYPPMPYVLERAFQEVYEDRGWDIARNVNTRGAGSPRRMPTLDDLAAKIPAVVDRMGYDARVAMDVKAGLLARVNQLRLAGGKGLMLNTRRPLDETAVFRQPCILELKQLVSDDEKAFLIGLLLIRLYEHHEARRERPGGLVHLTLIEEAHRLLRNVSTEQGSDVTANPQGRAVEVFANILSEIRAFGEGIVVAEQIPSKLTPDVLKNTGVKLVHRIVSPDDRDLLGRALNLDDAQTRRVATLGTGEAVAWTEHTPKALLVQVPAASREQIGVVTDDTVRAHAVASRGGRALPPADVCGGCPSVSGVCAGVPRDRWNSSLRLSFRRAFNALRLAPESVLPAFADFAHVVQRDARRSPNAACTFALMAEDEVERRGEFRGWPLADVDAVIASAVTLARQVLAAAERGAEHVATQTDLVAFQTRCAELDRTTTQPYPGCSLCDSPCNFRFDMSSLEQRHSADFRRGYLDMKVPTSRLARLACAAATRTFFIADAPSCAGAALCFGIQELADPALGISTYHQLEMAAVLKRQLTLQK